MNKKGLMVVLVLSLAINVSILGTSGYHYYRNSWRPQSPPCPLSPTQQHLYQELGLSKVQLSKMEPLARNFHERLAELRRAMKGKNTRLVEVLGQKDVGPVQVEGLRKEMADIQDEIQKEVIAHIIESKKIFDPKQQERFLTLMRQSMAEGNEL
jgi:Spy/CpxP family protein refolding chaperone